jgi:hypothetical protein
MRSVFASMFNAFVIRTLFQPRCILASAADGWLVWILEFPQVRFVQQVTIDKPFLLIWRRCTIEPNAAQAHLGEVNAV